MYSTERLLFTLSGLAIFICFQCELYFFNTVFIYFQGYKCIITGNNSFVHLRKLTCNFKDQAGKRITVAPNFIKRVNGNMKRFAHIVNHCFSFKYIIEII